MDKSEKSSVVWMGKGRCESAHDDAEYYFYVDLPSGRKLGLSSLNVEDAWTDREAYERALEAHAEYVSMIAELRSLK